MPQDQAKACWLLARWRQHCMEQRGEVLEGEYSHYCSSWDMLPVDETCLEFVACRCFRKESLVCR